MARHDGEPVLPYPQSPSSEDQYLHLNEHAGQNVPTQRQHVRTLLHRQGV